MFRAIGFVFGLIAIRVLMPDVFYAVEHALTSIFLLVAEVIAHAPAGVSIDAAQMTAGYQVLPH
jgi:hypothetical protein